MLVTKKINTNGLIINVIENIDIDSKVITKKKRTYELI